MTVKDIPNGQSVESKISSSSSLSLAMLEKLESCVDEVVENWNIDPETGDMKEEPLLEYYHQDRLRQLPKTSRFYVKKK